MISPTGLGIRKADKHGEGDYKAKRGNKWHKATDFICIPGNDIRAPINGIITREVLAYPDDHRWTGAEIQGEFMSIILLYFTVSYSLIGKDVKQGQVIGKAQDISEKYKGITPHVHLRIDSMDCEMLMRML